MSTLDGILVILLAIVGVAVVFGLAFLISKFGEGKWGNDDYKFTWGPEGKPDDS